MAAVAVAAEIGVVLVKADRAAALLGELSGAPHQNPFAGAVVRGQFVQRAAFGRAILRVGVVVVKAGAVAQHQVALDFHKTQFPRGILREIMRLVGILAQFLDVEAAHVGVRVFAVIIPAHEHAGLGGAAHQGDGLGHHVQVFLPVARDADFGFDAELDNRGCVDCGSTFEGN